jgi:multiple sugar transport system ATP-binding protein
MIARCPASFREAPGSRLSVHLNPRHLRLFDAASGAAI